MFSQLHTYGTWYILTYLYIPYMHRDLFVFICIHVRLQIPFPVFLSFWVRRRSTPHLSKETLSNQIPGMCQTLKVLSQYFLIIFLFFLVSLKRFFSRTIYPNYSSHSLCSSQFLLTSSLIWVHSLSVFH